MRCLSLIGLSILLRNNCVSGQKKKRSFLYIKIGKNGNIYIYFFQEWHLHHVINLHEIHEQMMFPLQKKRCLNQMIILGLQNDHTTNKDNYFVFFLTL